MAKTKKLIRFDWAMKKLLRDKANFGILEGFLSELLSDDIQIHQILDSESNKETHDDKHNRVDILVENAKGELVIVEVQNSKEYDYFHRILYGTSKVITEHIKEGKAYENVKKVISITIAYFDLGQGEDYVYHGITEFEGIHHGDKLQLAERQTELYDVTEVHQIYPEYWIIKVSKFNDFVQDKLDEWIYFFKNGEVQEGFSAKGIPEAKQKLDRMAMSEEEAATYKVYLKRLMDIASEQHTKMADERFALEALEKMVEEEREKARNEGRKQGLKEGRNEGVVDTQRQAVIGFFKNKIAPEIIAQSLNMSLKEVQEIIENYQ